MPMYYWLTAFQMARVFLFISFVAILIIGNNSPARADTYGISTNAPAVTSNDTISVTSTTGDETRGINYFGTGTIHNYGNITTVSTGGPGNSSYGVYSIPSASLIYNGGSISSTSVADGAGATSIHSPFGFNTITNNGRLTANAIGTGVAQAFGINTVNSVVTNNGDILVNSSAPNFSSLGIHNPNGVVINNGTISVTGNGNIGTIVGVSNLNVLTNSGTISATASSTLRHVYVYSAYTVGGQTTNSGTISASASSNGDEAFAYGVYNELGVNNSGTISASASSSGAGVFAYGIYDSVGAGGSLVSNSGNIMVSATGSGPGTAAWAFGIATNNTVINSGNISATVNGFFSSVYGISSGSGVTNTGNVSAVANSVAVGNAFGIDATGPGPVSNSGNITAAAHDGFINSALGIILTGNGNVTNKGNISVTADTTQSGMTTSSAYGITANGAGSVNNDGRITVHAQGSTADARGIFATANAAVNNSGQITVSAEGPNSLACGIYFAKGGTLTNTGIIRAGDDNAYEVYVNAGTVNLINRYNMILDGNPARGSIFLNGGSTINLNNSLFSITYLPETRFNTQYRIFDGTGAVNGNFGGILALNPAVSVLYNNQGTPGSIDDTVSLLYHPNASPALEGVNVNRYLLNATLEPVRQYQINGYLEGMLSGQPVQVAANDTVASDAPANLIPSSADDNFYFIPYYGDLKNDSGTLGYDAKLYGLTAGFDKRIGRHQLGFHLGISRADTDFNGTEFPFNTKEHENIFSLGFQGLSHWGNWILRGDVTGFYGYNDYSALSGTNFEALETADYHSWGTTENLMTGYTYKIGGSNVIYPEIGLNHVWIHQDGFTTQASIGGWQTDVSSVNDNLFQTLANIRWLNRISHQGLTFTTSAAIGGRYRLSNNDLSIEQTVPGISPVTITAEQERKAATASLSFGIKKNNLSAELAYSGDYSSDLTRHMGWLKFAYAF